MRVRIAAGLVVLGLAVAGCAEQQEPTPSASSDEASPSPTGDSPAPDEPTPDEPTPDEDPDQEGDDDQEASPTPPTLPQPAIWPAAGVVLETPEAAAQGFVTEMLDGPASLGDFRQGDQRSGEMPVLAEEVDATPAERGLLLLRRLAPDDGWFVLAGVSDTHSITSPSQGAEVAAGLVEVTGDVRGGAEMLSITAVVAGTGEVLDQQAIEVEGGTEATPFEVTLDLAAATPGSIVGLLVQDDVANSEDPGGFAAVAVLVR